MSSTYPNLDDVAVVGMSCRVAGADCPEELWDVLSSSKDVRSRIERFNLDGYYHPDGARLKGLTNVQHAYFMKEDLSLFDSAFFSIPPTEATAMDPQQRLLLELTYESMESAGITLDQFSGSNTGVFTGIFGNDYASMLARDPDATPKYNATGTSISIAANRVSYFFNLRGPSLAIDTACSSTMVALHQAVNALKAGEIDTAIVSGSNLILNMDMFIHMSELGFLSPNGRCSSFDSSGDGYVRAEGVLALILKPVRNALRDGDPIRAVIRGSRVNQDGRTQGITLPSSDAQEENLRGLYESLQLDPAETQYLEAHGTGTAAGDPLELSAIDAVFGSCHAEKEGKLIVGSVKSNIGHLESCAAIAGIVKTILCLEKGQIPPQMHFSQKTRNPKINFNHIHVPTSILKWPTTSSGFRRASVNSFGFGGTNGTTILDYYPRRRETAEDGDRPLLYRVSANNKTSLRRQAMAIASYAISKNPPAIDLAHTLLARRSNLKESIYVVAQNLQGLSALLNEPSTPSVTKRQGPPFGQIGTIFTGQGAQWPEMGKELLTHSRIFSQIMKECDEILQTLPEPPSWSVSEELSKPKESSRIYQANFSQPLCTALQLGLIHILRSWGIQLDFVVGHSSGEIAAAFAAGILSLRDAIIVAFYRGMFLLDDNDSNKAKGAMCAIGLSGKDCQPLLTKYKGKVALAAANSPSSSTLSGDADAIEDIVEQAKTDGIFCRALKVDMAYHSHHMLPKADAYLQALEKAGVQSLDNTASGCSMYSSVTGQKLSHSECTPEYWKTNMVSTVRFADAVKAASQGNQDNNYALIEFGPHPALKGPVMDTLASLGINEVPYFSTCFRNKPDMHTLLASAADMINAGVTMRVDQINALDSIDSDWSNRKTGQVLTDLPRYEWDHSQSYWGESRLAASYRQRSFRRHELLGARLPSTDQCHPAWRNRWMLSEIKWLEKVKSSGLDIIPPSAYLLMVVEACRQICDNPKIIPGLAVSDLKYHSDIRLDVFETEKTVYETYFYLYRDNETGLHQFEITGGLQNKDERNKLCSGYVRLSDKPVDQNETQGLTMKNDEKLMEYLSDWTGEFSDVFSNLKVSRTQITAEFPPSAIEEEHYPVEPSILGAILSLSGQVMSAEGEPSMYNLRSIKKLEIGSSAITSDVPNVVVDIHRIDHVHVSSAGYITTGNGYHLRLDGMNWEKGAGLKLVAPLKSLFFRTVEALDITTLESSNDITLADLLSLVTHKWPMADISSIVDDDAISSLILDTLLDLQLSKRLHFRSLAVLSAAKLEKCSKLRVIEDANNIQQSHLIFTGADQYELSSGKLHKLGMICIPKSQAGDTASTPIPDSFKTIATVSMPGNIPDYLLLRKYESDSIDLSKVCVVSTIPGLQRSSLSNLFPGSKHILLSSQTSSEWEKITSTSGDIVLLDIGNESVLTSSTGTDLLAWLQPLIQQTKHLVWVTRHSNNNPGRYMAGTFLRTIKTENPGIKSVNLHINGSLDKIAASMIETTYKRLLSGETEMELLATAEGNINTMRYKPDDQLEAKMSLAPPTRTLSFSSQSEYRIEVHGRSKAHIVIASSGSTLFAANNDQEVIVKVEYSLIDDNDARMFRGSVTPSHTLGSLCIGRVLNEDDPIWKKDQYVVCWTDQGTHQSTTSVHSKNCMAWDESQSPDTMLLEMEAITISSAVIKHCRVIARDNYLIDESVPVLWANTLQNAFHSAGAVALQSGQADFHVYYHAGEGILVNGRQLDIARTLKDTNLEFNFLVTPTKTDVPTFTLQHLDRAFLAVDNEAFSRALIHHVDHEKAKNTFVSGNSGPLNLNLFRSHGAYVMIGLGGLSEHLAPWMISKGARNLFAITRSGPDTELAKRVCAAVSRVGGKMRVLSGDASDIHSMTQTMKDIRSEMPIYGVFNMVLLLRNAPFSSMTAKQWDEALEVKVKSAQNLHISTSEDKLDFFVMFSSVSSIFGNRTQANYAVGNAYQTAFAEYRHSLGLPAISIALGAVTGIGVLAEDLDLQRSLNQNGLRMITASELEVIVAAAIMESSSLQRILLTTGFQMFKSVNGLLETRSGQDQVFWTEMPESGFMVDHDMNEKATAQVSLSEQLMELDEADAQALLLDKVLDSISSVLGYEKASLDPEMPLVAYGLDSLNAVACRYWFFKELQVDVPVFDVIGCKSIKLLVKRVLGKIEKTQGENNTPVIIGSEPRRCSDVTFRPLSHSQRRLWFLNGFIEDKTIYNLLLVSHIEGTVDAVALQQAWTTLMQRHEVLHSKIVSSREGLQLIPTENPTFDLTLVNASDDEFHMKEGHITGLAKSQIFDPARGELIKGWLLQSPTEKRFFLASHHLAWDRSSVPTIFSEVVAAYRALREKKDPSDVLGPVPHQFIDYTIWQNSCLEDKRWRDTQVSYWLENLRDTPESISLLPMAIVDSRPSVKQYSAGSYHFMIDQKTLSGVKRLCKAKAATPFMLMASVISALVYRLTGDEDVVIGIPDGDRGHSAFDAMVGFTVNMLAIRSKITKDMSYSDFLEQFRETCLGAYEHRSVPYDYLLHQMDVPRSTSHSPLFQISLNYQMQGDFPSADFGDFQYTTHDHYNARIQTDFGFEIEETRSGELHCVLDYDDAIYNATSAAEIAALYQVLLNSIIETDANASVDDLNLVSPRDRAEIKRQMQPQWNNLALKQKDLDHDTFFDRWRKNVSQSPNKVALTDDHSSYTYAELDHLTNKIANHLVASGVRPGDRIGISSEQSTDMLLAMYGVCKAGAAYVPLDPGYPEDRIISMLEDTATSVVIMDTSDEERITRILSAGIARENLFIVSELYRSDEVSSDWPTLERAHQPSDIFCCIFTSGSTGRPKGIEVSHQRLRYQMEGYYSCLGTNADHKILLICAMAFDLSLCAIYGSILLGTTMVVATKEARLSPKRMIDLVIDNQIGSTIFTTTQLKFLFSAPNVDKLKQWSSLHDLTLCGEIFPPWVCRVFFKLNLANAGLYNAYAPAETTVVNSLRRLTPKDALGSDTPLSGPLWPSKFSIVDAKGQILPFGVSGELIIGGGTVNRGYIKRPAETEKAFFQAIDGELWYKTGDKFRLDRDGTLHIAGRIGSDRQVKIRGIRTELGEIEAKLWEISKDLYEYGNISLAPAVVIYHQTEGSDGILTTYLTSCDGPALSAESQNDAESFLRMGASNTLPMHMRPTAYVFLEKLPTTASGKIDYKPLKARGPPDMSKLGQQAFFSEDQEGSRPLTPLEGTVSSIWAKSLNLDAEQTSFQSNHNFFKVGGHSLLLFQIQSMIEESCGVSLVLSSMFAQPTVAGVASLVQKALDEKHEADDPQSASKTKQLPDLDWMQEASLQDDWLLEDPTVQAPNTVVLTGATSLVGAYFLYQALKNTTLSIICIAIESDSIEKARSEVFEALGSWNLLDDAVTGALQTRVKCFPGSLAAKNLGLSTAQIDQLDRTTQAIYHLGTEVSLLKSYEGIKPANVESTRFLISLARGSCGNTKAIHYLSTWAVPHIQIWHDSQLRNGSSRLRLAEEPMTHFVPGSPHELGYLKTRWVSETMLCGAAKRGLPVSIYRSSMFAPSPKMGVSSARTDINRRILAGSLATGLVPDFGSDRGGGMSWVTADYVADSMLHFGTAIPYCPSQQARFVHLVAEQHIPYNRLPDLLNSYYAARYVSQSSDPKPSKLSVVSPEEWFTALRAVESQKAEMELTASALESMWNAGWIPFTVDTTTSKPILESVGISPPNVDGSFLMDTVVGNKGF